MSCTHFIALIPLKDDLQRDFSAEMCRLEGWSVRALRKKIDLEMGGGFAFVERQKRVVIDGEDFSQEAA